MREALDLTLIHIREEERLTRRIRTEQSLTLVRLEYEISVLQEETITYGVFIVNVSMLTAFDGVFLCANNSRLYDGNVVWIDALDVQSTAAHICSVVNALPVESTNGAAIGPKFSAAFDIVDIGDEMSGVLCCCELRRLRVERQTELRLSDQITVMSVTRRTMIDEAEEMG